MWCIESLSSTCYAFTNSLLLHTDIVAFLFHQCCQQVVKCMHVCDNSTLSLIAWMHLIYMEPEQHVVKVHGVGEALWQGLVNVQCKQSPEVVTATADVLDELGLKEEATQLRGSLICQSLADE